MGYTAGEPYSVILRKTCTLNSLLCGVKLLDCCFPILDFKIGSLDYKAIPPRHFL